MPVSPHHPAGAQMPSLHTHAVKRSGSEGPTAEGDTPVAKRAKSDSSGARPRVTALPPDDVLHNIFGRIESRDVPTFRALKLASADLKESLARTMPNINPMIASVEAVNFLRKNSDVVPPRLQEALTETHYLDLSAFDDNASGQLHSPALVALLAQSMHIKTLKLCRLDPSHIESVIAAISGMTNLESLTFSHHENWASRDFYYLIEAFKLLPHLSSIRNLNVPTTRDDEPKHTPLSLLLDLCSERTNLENLFFSKPDSDWEGTYFTLEELSLYALVVAANPKLKNVIIGTVSDHAIQADDCIANILLSCAKSNSIESFDVDLRAISLRVMKQVNDSGLHFAESRNLTVRHLEPEQADRVAALASIITMSPNLSDIKILRVHPGCHFIQSLNASTGSPTQSHQHTLNEAIDLYEQAVNNLRVIQSFSLSITQDIDVDSRALRLLSHFIPRRPSIQNLELSLDDNLSAECADVLIDIVAAMPRLKTLDFRASTDEVDFYFKMARIIPHLQNLRSLTVEKNRGNSEDGLIPILETQFFSSLIILPNLETFNCVDFYNDFASNHRMHEILFRQQGIKYNLLGA